MKQIMFNLTLKQTIATIKTGSEPKKHCFKHIKPILSLLILIIHFSVFAQKKPIPLTKDNFQVEIQTSAICEICQEAIEYELTFTKGVKNASLDLETKIVTIIYQGKKITADEIRSKITGIGYHADDVPRDPEAYEKLLFCCKDEEAHSVKK